MSDKRHTLDANTENELENQTAAVICHCDYCHYTFNADVISYSKYHIPTRCPDCGKKVIHTLSGSYPAVRAATEEEVADYYRIQREILEEMDENIAEKCLINSPEQVQYKKV